MQIFKAALTTGNWPNNPEELVRDPQGDYVLYVDVIKADALARKEAENLAIFLWNKHYNDEAPDFELCDSTAGILSQIDNMVCGLIKDKYV